MNINLFAFNFAAGITNVAHSTKRAVENLVPSVTTRAVQSVDAVSDIATAFAAGMRYANIINKQTGQSATYLTVQDGKNLHGMVEVLKA